MKQFRKFSAAHDQMLLDEQYLFAYSAIDGFSERGLKAELVIDYDYHYTLELKAFDHEKMTTNHSDCIVEKGKLLSETLAFMEQLLSSDFNSLKQEYNFETFDVTDIGSQQFFINLDEVTKSVHILNGLPAEYFETTVEQNLFAFNEYLKKWIETKYRNWISTKP